MIRVRRPKTDDRHIIRLIRQELIPLNPPDLRPVLSERAVVRRLNEGTTYVWTPDEASGQRVQGFITVLTQFDLLFVDMLALHRTVQGRGIGTQLLRRAERFGRRVGCKVMRLYVNEGNERGIRFYEKNGMQMVFYDSRRRSFLMEKPIA